MCPCVCLLVHSTTATQRDNVGVVRVSIAYPSQHLYSRDQHDKTLKVCPEEVDHMKFVIV